MEGSELVNDQWPSGEDDAVEEEKHLLKILHIH